MTPDPCRTTRSLLLASLLGFFYRGHWIYSAADKTGIRGYLELASGHGEAPFQYRVGVIKTAAWMFQYAHFPFRYSFSLMDLVGSVTAVMLAYQLLISSAIYRRASLELQWFGSASFLALVLYLLSWQDWFKEVETLPAAALVMLMLYLWSTAGRSWLTGLLLIAVTLAQSLIRAEVALMLNLGVFLVALGHRRGSLALTRGWAMTIAGLGMAVAAGTQLFLMKVAYPTAHYQSGPVFMLPHDIWRPNEVFCFLIFLLPAAWTLHQVLRSRFAEDAAGVGFLFGAIPFVILWMLIGRLEEVRIFLPMALAITPLTVKMAMTMLSRQLAEPLQSR